MFSYLRGLALRVAADPSAIVLLASNIVAVVFAFFNPPVSLSVTFLYWAECAVIGGLNVVKLWLVYPNGLSPGAEDALRKLSWLKLILVGTFLVHYGMFLLFLFSVLRGFGMREMEDRGVQDFDLASHLAGFWLLVLVVAAGHVLSFFRNFLGKKEYVGRNFLNQMFRPYKRTGVMMLVLIVADMIVITTRMPQLALAIVIPFMLIANLEAHFRDRSA